MKNNKSTTKSALTGIRPAMEAFGIRIPQDEAHILRQSAKKMKCGCADLVRTAWNEYITNHQLTELVK